MLNRWPLVILLTALAIAVRGTAAAQEEAQLSVDPPSQTVDVDSGFDVRVLVDDVTTADGLGGYTLVMDYDPDVLLARTITDSGFVASTGNSATCPASGVDAEAGRAAHFCFTLPLFAQPGPQTSEPQLLATVHFEPVAEGTSTLDISQSTLIDVQGDGILVTTRNGQVTVGSGGPGPTQAASDGSPTVTPAPGGAQLPPSGNKPDDGTGPTALYIALIVAGALGLTGIAAFSIARARRRAS